MDSSIESKQKKLAKHYEKLSRTEFETYKEALENEIERIVPYCYSNYYFYNIISKYFNGQILDFDEQISLEALLEVRKIMDYSTKKEYLIKEFGGILTEEEIENVLSFTKYNVDASVLDYIDAVKNQELSSLRKHISLLKFRKIYKKY